MNGAMAHGQLPLPRLLHLLHPSDTHDHKPLPFQVRPVMSRHVTSPPLRDGSFFSFIDGSLAAQSLCSPVLLIYHLLSPHLLLTLLSFSSFQQVMFATVPREQQWTPCDAATWLVLGHGDKAPPLHLGGLSLQPLGLSPAYAPCDLTLLVSEDVHVSPLTLPSSLPPLRP